MIENVYPTEIVSFLLFQSMVSHLWKHSGLSLRPDDWGRSLILEHTCIRLHVAKSKCYFTTLFHFIFFSWLYSSLWTERRSLNARWIVGLDNIFMYSSEKELFDGRRKFRLNWLQICSWQLQSNCIKDSWTSHLFNWPNKIKAFRQSGQKRSPGAHTSAWPLLGKHNASLWQSNNLT